MITGGPSKPFTSVPMRSLAFGLMGPMIRVQPRAFAQARAASKSARAASTSFSHSNQPQ